MSDQITKDLVENACTKVDVIIRDVADLLGAVLDSERDIMHGLVSLYGAVIMTGAGPLSNVLSRVLGREANESQTMLAARRVLLGSDENLDDVARGCIEDDLRLTGNTLERGAFIENDFYRLKSQESTLSPAVIQLAVEEVLMKLRRKT